MTPARRTEGFIASSDSAFLTLIVLVSLALYVGRLGFYSDDWGFLAKFDLSSDKSIGALFGAAGWNVRIRPVQLLYLIGLHKAFGLNPLGYHLVNAAVLVANSLLFYVCLRELRQPRVLALAIPLVFILLPHYSTDRFWFAAFQVPLSMACYLSSLYCDLRASRAGRWRLAAWKLPALGAALASLLAYETTLVPLLLVNPLLVWWSTKIRRAETSQPELALGARLLLYAGTPALVVSGLVWKAFLNQRRTGLDGSPLELIARLSYRVIDPTHRDWSPGFNIWQFLEVDLIDRGLKLPFLALETLVRGYAGWTEAASAVAIATVTFAYLYRVSRREPDALFHQDKRWSRLAGIGLAAALAGYAVFFVLSNVQFTLTGMSNRVSMTAAAGLAVFFVAAIGWAACRASARHARLLFAAAVAVFAASGCLVDNAIASFWIAASERQKVVIGAIQAHFPSFPKGATLILDGMCPYIGPGIVFETHWDFGGALRLHYRDPALWGDVAKPRMRVTPYGLRTRIYRELKTYRYGPNLIVYDAGRDVSQRLTDVATARRYFADPSRRARAQCPYGSEGMGARIF